MFTLFPILPRELRLRIWGEALCVRTVVATVSNDALHGYRNLGGSETASASSICMSYIGPAPFAAGLTCKEARLLMEQLYGKPMLDTTNTAWWVHMDQTVFDLGNVCLAEGSDVMTSWKNFHADDLSRFKHVAIEGVSVGQLERIFRPLARSCPALRTIILLTNQKVDGFGPFSVPLSEETADYFANLLAYPRTDSEYQLKSTTYLYSLLTNLFGAPPPRTYVLPPYLDPRYVSRGVF